MTDPKTAPTEDYWRALIANRETSSQASVAASIAQAQVREEGRTFAAWLTLDESLAVESARAALNSKREAIRLVCGDEADKPHEGTTADEKRLLELDGLIDGEWDPEPTLSLCELLDRKLRARAHQMSAEQLKNFQEVRVRLAAIDQIFTQGADPSRTKSATPRVRWMCTVKLALDRAWQRPGSVPHNESESALEVRVLSAARWLILSLTSLEPSAFVGAAAKRTTDAEVSAARALYEAATEATSHSRNVGEVASVAHRISQAAGLDWTLPSLRNSRAF